MRVLSNYTVLLLALAAPTTFANALNCISINSNLAVIETLAESGQYRNLAPQSQTFSTDHQAFNYQKKHSYAEYLSFAQAKIKVENPKAKLKCPIETGVTIALDKNKSELTIADLVAPFELKADNNKRAILLVHGLTDSPYLFHDLASFYHNKGINVRTLLLPGHGTAPQALLDISYQDWQQATQFAISKMFEDFDQVYLGGFSTGGALILDYLRVGDKQSPCKTPRLTGIG